MATRRVLLRVVIVAAGIGLALQLVPYGWSHPNPPVTQAVVWPNAGAERIARAACYDCHSNETDWPPYSYVAPMSWLVRRDVERGRDELNFSEWDRDDGEADDAADAVLEGSMPPRQYELMHSGARLSGDERAILVAALEELDASRG